MPTSTAFSISKSLDFTSSQYYSGVDVNGTSLSLLPQEWKWDFESGSFSSDWTLSGASNWAIQGSNALVGSQTAKAGTITHNQVTTMTLDVSSLPAGTGTFNYQVSSEGSFDFLKLASSAGNIANRKIVSSESFIKIDFNYNSLKFDDYERLAGNAFAAGINQIVFHGYPYEFSFLEN
mgnify:CR=1 FL=1